MTNYERALAKEHVDDAMLLGHMTLRIAARARTAVLGLGKSASRLLSPRSAESARGR